MHTPIFPNVAKSTWIISPEEQLKFSFSLEQITCWSSLALPAKAKEEIFANLNNCPYLANFHLLSYWFTLLQMLVWEQNFGKQWLAVNINRWLKLQWKKAFQILEIFGCVIRFFVCSVTSIEFLLISVRHSKICLWNAAFFQK